MDGRNTGLRISTISDRSTMPGVLAGNVLSHPAQDTKDSRQEEVTSRRFTSSAYPGDANFPLLFGRSLIEPLAWCLVPLMILSVVSALQGFSILALIITGVPAACTVATAWTVHRLKSELALIWIAGPNAAVVSVWECFHPPTHLSWLPVLDLRVARDACYATIGDATIELEQTRWPDYNSIIDALRAARQISRLGT